MTMEKIEPYRTLEEALRALDNGGRFYNILTKADDGEITPAEIGKAAGIFNDKQQMVLFLELATSRLTEQEKAALAAKLEDDLQARYQKYKPREFLPSEAGIQEALAANVIITGVPKHVESKTEFSGFVMVPIMVGKVMTLMPIPINQQYDVYELRDEVLADTFLIAHAKGEDKLPEERIRVGGVIKELKADKEEREASRTFLEAVYYTEAV